MAFFKKRRKKVGLALGGGAARGFAHLGVLKRFVHHKIPIDYICGASAGSIAGGLFAAGIDIHYMIDQVTQLTWRDFIGFHISKMGMFSSKPLRKFVEKYIKEVTFRELKIPFAAIATNIITGQPRVFNEPDRHVSEAIQASASFPGIFSPTYVDNVAYFDGGASANVPSRVVREMGADVVIAIDVISTAKLDHVPRHIATLADRGLDLLLNTISRLTEQESDLVIRPVTERVTSFHVKRAHHLIKLGERAVDQHLESIHELL